MEFPSEILVETDSKKILPLREWNGWWQSLLNEDHCARYQCCDL